jgi:hypothetical protein
LRGKEREKSAGIRILMDGEFTNKEVSQHVIEPSSVG